jgi:hypothetical protein
MLIAEDYIEEFMKMLPKDKITIIEENFEQNKQLLAGALEQYTQENKSIPLQETMKHIDTWLKTKE